MPNRKLIELLIDEETENFGVEAISLVKYPAIESNFIYFSKQGDRRAMYAMASVDEDKRTLIGPALIPNKHIPRYDEFSGEEYDVYFSEQTVSQAAELFLKQNRSNNHTFEHQDAVDGVSVVESWIVTNPEMDKSRHFNIDVPQGTWMVRVHVANDDMWKFVKENKVSGFSIEGYFMDKIENMSDHKKDAPILKRIKELLSGRKLYAEILTDNGQNFATEHDKFESGAEVYKIGPEGTKLEVKNGSYKTQAGTTFEVFDGVVTEWDGEVQEVEETNDMTEMKNQLKAHYERQLASQQKRRKFNALKEWWIFMDPYDYDYRNQGFYIYPFRHNSYSDYLDALEDAKQAIPQVEEWENADSDGYFEYTTDGVGISEKNWTNLKELSDLANSLRVEFETIMEADNHFGQSGASYLEEAYYGEYDTLRDLAIDMVSDGNLTGQDIDNYFDFEKFGRELKMGGDVDFMADGNEAEYDRLYNMRDQELGEYYIYDYAGGSNPSDVISNAENYMDYDKIARDLDMEFTIIGGHAWLAH